MSGQDEMYVSWPKWFGNESISWALGDIQNWMTVKAQPDEARRKVRHELDYLKGC